MDSLHRGGYGRRQISHHQLVRREEQVLSSSSSAIAAVVLRVNLAVCVYGGYTLLCTAARAILIDYDFRFNHEMSFLFVALNLTVYSELFFLHRPKVVAGYKLFTFYFLHAFQEVSSFRSRWLRDLLDVTADVLVNNLITILYHTILYMFSLIMGTSMHAVFYLWQDSDILAFLHDSSAFFLCLLLFLNYGLCMQPIYELLYYYCLRRLRTHYCCFTSIILLILGYMKWPLSTRGVLTRAAAPAAQDVRDGLFPASRHRYRRPGPL